MKVAKFGGSSAASAEQIKKIEEIVNASKRRKVIIVSAPGKRFDKDVKVTDLLYACHNSREQNFAYEEHFNTLSERFLELEKELNVDVNMKGELATIKDNLDKGTTADYMASRGEYLNARLIAAYLGREFVDTQGLVLFNEKGKLMEKETNKALAEALSKTEGAVVPGFYGSNEKGEIVTFSRGGSDITGAIVARALKASVYENWTDVSGFLMADPRIVDNPKSIEEISYKELRELSYMGASVLHEDAIYPAKVARIPINIRNTNAPKDPGTMITAETRKEDKEHIITGIAGKKGFIVITLYKNKLTGEIGFIRRLAGIFEDFDVALEHIPTGIDTMSAVVSKEQIGDHLEEILEAINTILKPDSIEIVEDMALIATVGYGMHFRKGVSANLFAGLAEADVNVRMIDQGSSELNIIVGVAEEDFNKSIKAIYNSFVGA